MPRNSEGAYSLPAGTFVSTGDTLLVSQHNPPFADIASVISDSLDRDGLGAMRADLDMGSHKIENLTPGTNPTDAATVSQLTAGAGVPVGVIADFAGSTAPDGWLICAGQSLTRTGTYAALFAVIGTTYGAPSGTTFNLPDLRGRVTAGRDLDQGGVAGRLTNTTMTPNGTTLGAVGGAQTVTLTSDQMPVHTHGMDGSTDSAGAHTHTVQGAAGILLIPSSPGETEAAQSTSISTDSAGTHSHTLSGSIGNAGGGTAHSNVQPTILMNRIIRAVSS